ncbi:MAG: hypothetical protein FWE74_02905 [Oscillospiraceae bacterium]|nr:hypothetical protein [Oscillospiraceae bacterium]
MILAMAQILDVSPYYYTGESDETGEFSDDVLKSFLTEKKLAVAVKKGAAAKAIAAKPSKKAAAVKAEKPAKRGRKAAVKAAPKAVAKKAAPAPKAEQPASPKNNEVFIQVSIPKSPKLQKAIANLDEEGAVLLLRALMRKSDASDQAKALCDIIKSCLLS